ncbi:TetR/AcrR family transcriptional regulator [Sphaerisporangium viridialbum]|uniref:TetR/AcrR family transcriptional regulator n=1 Tax=Sphaerisporangium viridialbum TaxID=46189 RepID=UPI003C754336
MAEGRVRARPGEGPRLREEILEAAEALLIETGTEDALTLRAVARRTGVSTPSVYMHFAGKEALVEAVCLRVWDELGRRVREQAAGAGDPFRALGRCGRAYARFALDHPVQYRLLMMRPAAVKGVPPAAAACFGHMVDAVSACVEAGVMRGSPETLALGMWSAVHGLVSLLIAQPSFPWPDDLDALIDQTVRMAGFGTALVSRLPRHGVPPSPELNAGLDHAAARLTAHGQDFGQGLTPRRASPR